MLVIADSSALIALSICDALGILPRLYDDVRVPQAVYDEVVITGKLHSEPLRIFLTGRVAAVDLTHWVLAAGGLGQGELEAMALYKQLSADVLLIDDRRARAVAENNQIHCIGALGVLLLAKHRGVILQVSDYIEKLRSSSLFYDDELLASVLSLAKE